MTLYDVDFLRMDEPPELRLIYEYRTGLLRWALLERVKQWAGSRDQVMVEARPVELDVKLTESSLWGQPPLVLCEIGAGVREGDMQGALSLIAGGAVNPLCLIIRTDHALTSSPSWKRATDGAVVIREPIVSSRNLGTIAGFLMKWRGFDGMSQCRSAEAVDLLTRAIGSGQWDLLRAAHMLDSALLTPWVIEGDLNARRSARGDLLNERLKDFLDWRDSSSMQRLLALLASKNGGEQLFASRQLLSDLYKRSERIIGRRDILLAPDVVRSAFRIKPDLRGPMASVHRCEGFRMPAGRELPRGWGPASESLQGRNPRELRQASAVRVMGI